MRLAAFAFALVSATAAVSASPSYVLEKSVTIGAPDRWDYVVYDDQTKRVYLAHGDRLAVIDGEAGVLVAEVKGISGGTHGSAISLATHQGFTDDGRNGKAVAFDLSTFRVTRQIPADVDADAIALDRATGRLFVIEGDPAAVTVIDPKTDQPITTIKAGEKLEYAVGDGRGSIYAAGEEKGDILKIDARTNRITARWPTLACESPHGIAIDAVSHRVFMGCVNKSMMVVDTVSGKVVANLPIGRGSDAIAFDPVRRRVFSSNGADGTITVYQQRSPNDYVALSPVTTAVSARTMSLDPRTGRLFVAAADTDPNPTPGGRPKVRPGTLKLLIFRPQA